MNFIHFCMNLNLLRWQFWLIGLAVLVLAIVGGFLVFRDWNKSITKPSPSEVVETENNAVISNYQNNQSTSNQSKTFTSQKGVLITLENFNEKLTCPLIIRGAVTGTWFFEAEFQAQIISSETTLANLIARATNENWMTEAPVNFVIEYDCSNCLANTQLQLKLQKNNPSGLPEFDDSVIIPISLENCS